MLQLQEKCFYLRRKQPEHSGAILNQSAGSQPEEVFRRMSGRVLSYHMASRPYATPPAWPEDYGPDDLPPHECIAHLFHHEFFVPMSLFKGLAGGRVEINRFLSTIKRHVQRQERNNVQFLTGDVGSGKRTFISNLIVKHGFEWISKPGLVPIRLALDLELEHSLQPRQAALLAIHRVILGGFSSMGLLSDSSQEQIYEQTAFRKTDDLSRCERAVTNLFHQVRAASEKQVLLVIDNLDCLYHIYDRGLFAKQAGDALITPDQQDVLVGQREEAYGTIRYVIRAFIDENVLGRLGASILIVLRKDSLQHYRRTTHPDVPAPFDFRLHTFRVQPPPLKDVLSAHGGLLRAAITRLPDDSRNRVFTEAAQALEAAVADEERRAKRRLHEDLVSLARQGLRQIILHYSHFIWLPIGIDEEGGRYQLSRRFHDQYTPSLLAFLLNGNRLFTQFEAEFPNMYLVRGDAIQEQDPGWASLVLPHRHTYWLKRLLLEFIAHKEKKDETVTPGTVYRAFCADVGGTGCFEESIVRLCLGSLAQVECSHVIDFDFVPSENDRASHVVEEIRLTERGRRLVNGFMDSFTYLQLVVDDWLLPLPKSISSDFKYSDLDYGYLVDPPALYGDRLLMMIKRKIRQVFTFIEVLRVALEYEQQVFPTAFARLRESEVTIPSVDSVQRKVSRDLDVITRRFSHLDYRQLTPDREALRRKIEEDLKIAYSIDPCS